MSDEARVMSGDVTIVGKESGDSFPSSLRLVSLISAHLYGLGLRVWRQLMLLSIGRLRLICYLPQEPLRRIKFWCGVHDECIARQDSLVLGDLAEITSRNSQTADLLRAIPLGYAPEGRRPQGTHKREDYAGNQRAAGFSPEQLTVVAPPIVVIRRESQIVDPALIREAVARVSLAGLAK